MRERYVPLVEGMACKHEVVVSVVEGVMSAAAIGDSLMKHGYYTGAQLLVVTSHGPGIQAHYGSVTRHCMQSYRQPLAVVPAPLRAAHGPVTAVVQSSNEAHVLGAWVAENLTAMDSLEVQYVQYADGEGVEAVRDALQATLPGSIQARVQAKASDFKQGEFVEGTPCPSAEVYDAICREVEQAAARIVILPSYTSQGVARQIKSGQLSDHCCTSCTQPMLFVPFLDDSKQAPKSTPQ